MKTTKQLVQELPRNRLEEIVMGVVEILYPDRDSDFEWDADTLDEIVWVLDEHNLVPTS